MRVPNSAAHESYERAAMAETNKSISIDISSKGALREMAGDYAGRRRRGTDGLARAALAASLSEW
jgi:hypothetical protein